MLNKKKATIDPPEKVWIEIELLECIDGLQPQSFFNLNFSLVFTNHIIPIVVYRSFYTHSFSKFNREFFRITIPSIMIKKQRRVFIEQADHKICAVKFSTKKISLYGMTFKTTFHRTSSSSNSNRSQSLFFARQQFEIFSNVEVSTPAFLSFSNRSKHFIIYEFPSTAKLRRSSKLFLFAYFIIILTTSSDLFLSSCVFLSVRFLFFNLRDN